MPGNETYMVNPHKRAPPGRVRVRVQLLQRQRGATRPPPPARAQGQGAGTADTSGQSSCAACSVLSVLTQWGATLVIKLR